MIGLNVKQYRNEANLTQSELAERIGSAQTVINGIETGTRGFSIEYLEKIADTLKLPVFKFFASEPLVPQSVAEKEPTIIEIFPDQETKIEFEKLRSRDDFIPVRIVGAASLGQGRIVTSEETKGYTLIYRHVLPKGTEKRKRHENPRIVALYVEGDSMIPTRWIHFIKQLDVSLDIPRCDSRFETFIMCLTA